MKIAITLHGKKERILTASLNDSDTACDFLALLPITIQLNDLFNREKYGQLPKALAMKGKKEFSYKVGQIVYWAPSHDVAIYYHDDGTVIPPPGIIVMGQIDANIESLNRKGNFSATFEREN